MLFANKQRFLSIITVTNYAKEKIFTICNKKKAKQKSQAQIKCTTLKKNLS